MQNYFLSLLFGAALLLGCKDPVASYSVFETDWNAHTDSLGAVLFLPDPNNIQREISFLENFLTKIQSEKKRKGYDARLDSLEMKVIEASQLCGRWYFDLEKYRVDNFINEKTDSSQFLEKLKIIPPFLNSGQQTLRPENISIIEKHIDQQSQSYFFIKSISKNYPKEAEEAQLAIKKYISYLRSVKNNQFSIDEIKNSR